MNALWWKSAATRALRTMAQYAMAYIAVGMTINDVQWIPMLSGALVAGIASMIFSLAGLPEVREKERADDNERCYTLMAEEANTLREQLYPVTIEDIEE